jgi:FkbM family methyltransferase
MLVQIKKRLTRNQLLISVERKIRKYRRRIFYYAALNGLDKKIENYLPSKGFFVEAGANDGLNQSNTLFLERKYHWNGLLIEPIPRLAHECAKNRKKSLTMNVALVSPANSGKLVELVDVDLMSVVADSKNANESILRTAEEIQGISRERCSITGLTLTSVLDSANAPTNFELLSLDVEGFELEVLQGLDLSKFAPQFILIETNQISDVLNVLNGKYILAEKLSQHDYFLRLIPEAQE